jgi:hypothetical protein
MALLPGAAWAKVNLSVEIGWNGAFRPGRWAPIYITAADTQAVPARNVIIEIKAPHDKTFALSINTAATIRQEPTTFLVYVPLTFQLEDTVAIIRDSGSLKTLAEVPFDQPKPGGGYGGYYGSSGGEILLGVSGTPQHGLGVIKGQFNWKSETPPPQNPNQPNYSPPSVQVGYLESRMLPDAQVGYNCLDALVLATPDLVNMSQQRQEAIATWVRAGGRLILWPGDGLFPADSPIVTLLPCTIGLGNTMTLSLDETKSHGLASRVENVPTRKLTPTPAAEKLDLLDGKALAYFGRAGLGQVAVLSLDASKLVFNDPIAARKFWRPIFHRTLRPYDETHPRNYYGWGSDPAETRRLASAEQVIDRLGNVEGVGRFDFSYVALVMVAMMLIVGPIDWFILRKLGRQQWTWVTTAGWIGLITFGALYVGHMLKSGELHYRTVRVIDQVDDKVVGVIDVAGIYSPRTQAYNLEGPRDCWWEPVNVDLVPPWRQGQRAAATIQMIQDRHGQKLLTRFDRDGNRVPAMNVNVWNLRFMQSELGDPSAEQPFVLADLRIEKVGRENRLRGTITNRTTTPLNHIFIMTKAGTARREPAAIPPMQSVTIDLPIEAAPVKPVDVSNYQPNSPYVQYMGAEQSNPYTTAGPEFGFIHAATDMADTRSQRLLELLGNRDDLACVYGLFDKAPATVKVESAQNTPALEQHWQVVRALVPLKK